MKWYRCVKKVLTCLPLMHASLSLAGNFLPSVNLYSFFNRVPTSVGGFTIKDVIRPEQCPNLFLELQFLKGCENKLPRFPQFLPGNICRKWRKDIEEDSWHFSIADRLFVLAFVFVMFVLSSWKSCYLVPPNDLILNNCSKKSSPDDVAY